MRSIHFRPYGSESASIRLLVRIQFRDKLSKLAVSCIRPRQATAIELRENLLLALKRQVGKPVYQA